MTKQVTQFPEFTITDKEFSEMGMPSFMPLHNRMIEKIYKMS